MSKTTERSKSDSEVPAQGGGPPDSTGELWTSWMGLPLLDVEEKSNLEYVFPSAKNRIDRIEPSTACTLPNIARPLLAKSKKVIGLI